MYKHEITPFGKYEKHRFYSKASGNSFSLVPAHGACLLDLVFGGQSVLDGYRTPEEVDFDNWGKSAVLYPFPNRLSKGTYEWDGERYQFPLNDLLNGHALHGFGTDRNMLLEVVEVEETSAFLLCVDTYTGDNPAFPFPFTFYLMYQMDDREGFTVSLSVQNDGTKDMPFGFGWHPYFQLGERIDAVQLQLPPCEMIGIDQTMIPTGKRYAFDDFAKPRDIGATVLDNGFYVGRHTDQLTLRLAGDRGTMEYWQETGTGRYDYLQLFTPPYRSSIAVEPMTCNIDAFNNGDGLLRLAPDERAAADFGVRMV